MKGPKLRTRTRAPDDSDFGRGSESMDRGGKIATREASEKWPMAVLDVEPFSTVGCDRPLLQDLCAFIRDNPDATTEGCIVAMDNDRGIVSVLTDSRHRGVLWVPLGSHGWQLTRRGLILSGIQ